MIILKDFLFSNRKSMGFCRNFLFEKIQNFIKLTGVLRLIKMLISLSEDVLIKCSVFFITCFAESETLTFVSNISVDEMIPLSVFQSVLEKSLNHDENAPPQVDGVMSERTFILSMLASIFSCSTCFLACAMLDVLLLAMAALTRVS